jgi:hypothetical protein
MTTSPSNSDEYPKLRNGPYADWRVPPPTSGIYQRKIFLFPDCECHGNEKYVYLKKLDTSQSEPVIYYMYAGSIITEEADDGGGMDSCGFEFEPEN